jgi:hypothetical protein
MLPQPFLFPTLRRHHHEKTAIALAALGLVAAAHVDDRLRQADAALQSIGSEDMKSPPAATADRLRGHGRPAAA